MADVTIENPSDPAMKMPVRVQIDTGYTGFLTLRPETIQELQLPRWGNLQVGLAEGSRQQLDRYVVRVHWHDRAFPVPVLELGGEPLLGMGLLWGSRLTVDAQEGGAVVIEEIPAPA